MYQGKGHKVSISAQVSVGDEAERGRDSGVTEGPQWYADLSVSRTGTRP